MRQNDSKEENDFKRKVHIKDANAKIVFGNHEKDIGSEIFAICTQWRAL